MEQGLFSESGVDASLRKRTTSSAPAFCSLRRFDTSVSRLDSTLLITHAFTTIVLCLIQHLELGSL